MKYSRPASPRAFSCRIMHQPASTSPWRAAPCAIPTDHGRSMKHRSPPSVGKSGLMQPPSEFCAIGGSVERKPAVERRQTQRGVKLTQALHGVVPCSALPASAWLAAMIASTMTKLGISACAFSAHADAASKRHASRCANPMPASMRQRLQPARLPSACSSRSHEVQPRGEATKQYRLDLAVSPQSASSPLHGRLFPGLADMDDPSWHRRSQTRCVDLVAQLTKLARVGFAVVWRSATRGTP